MNNSDSKKLIPIFSPRSNFQRIIDQDEFFLKEMHSKLDPFTISVLKKQFELFDDNMNMSNFMRIMKEHLKDWNLGDKFRQVRLARILIRLFRQIDLNMSNSMQWAEFSTYIMTQVNTATNVQSQSDESRSYQLDHFKLQQNLSFPVKKMIYLRSHDRIAIFQQNQKTIYFVDQQKGIYDPKPLKVVSDTIPIETSMMKKDKDTGIYNMTQIESNIEIGVLIIDIAEVYYNEVSYIAVATTDKKVRIYKKNNKDMFEVAEKLNKEKRKIQMEREFKFDVLCLVWEPNRSTLILGLINGNLFVWPLDFDNEKSAQEEQDQSENEKDEPLIQKKDLEISDLKEKFEKQKKKIIKIQNQPLVEKYIENAHTDVVQVLINLQSFEFVASGGLDGQIHLWDSASMEKRRTFNGHERGIITLAFNQKNILIFSGGLDHWIGVWNIYTDSLVQKIDGFMTPVTNIIVNKESNDLITIEQNGQIRVRDLFKFNMKQTVLIDQITRPHKMNTNSAILLKAPEKIVFGGFTLIAFKKEKNVVENNKEVDEKYAVCCQVGIEQMLFYTPCGSTVKVWSILEGTIQKQFYDILSYSDITAFILDESQQCMVLGDEQGNAGVYNALNGALIKNLAKHSSEIIHIVEANCENIQAIITASKDGKINVNSDVLDDNNELMRVITLQEQVIKGLGVFQDLSYLAVGLQRGQVAFFQIQSGQARGQTFLNKEGFQMITSIEILQNYPFMMVTKSSGEIGFISLPPMPEKFQEVEQIVVRPLIEQKKDRIGIHLSKLNMTSEKLFIIDDQFYLKCIEMKYLISNFSDYTLELREFIEKGSQGKMSQYKPFTEQNNIVDSLWHVKAHDEPINSIDVDQRNNLVVTCSYDKTVKIFNGVTGEFIQMLKKLGIGGDIIPIGFYHIENEQPVYYKKDKTKILKDSDMQASHATPLNLSSGVDQKDLNPKSAQIKNHVNLHPGAKQQEKAFVSEIDSDSSQLSSNQNNLKGQQPAAKNTKNLKKSASQEKYFDFSLVEKNDYLIKFNPNFGSEELLSISDEKGFSAQSNIYWQLVVDFQKYFENFEKETMDLIQEVVDIEQYRTQKEVNNIEFEANEFETAQGFKMKFDLQKERELAQQIKSHGQKIQEIIKGDTEFKRNQKEHKLKKELNQQYLEQNQMSEQRYFMKELEIQNNKLMNDKNLRETEKEIFQKYFNKVQEIQKRKQSQQVHFNPNPNPVIDKIKQELSKQNSGDSVRHIQVVGPQTLDQFDPQNSYTPDDLIKKYYDFQK